MIAPSTIPNRRMVAVRRPERLLRVTLVALAGLIALCALTAGLALTLNPDGRALGLDVHRLEPTPFTSFAIPGLMLSALGAVFAAGGVLVLLGKPEGLWISAAAGVALLVWIIAQVALLGYASVLQSLFFSLGVAVVAIAMVLGRRPREARRGR